MPSPNRLIIERIKSNGNKHRQTNTFMVEREIGAALYTNPLEVSARPGIILPALDGWLGGGRRGRSEIGETTLDEVALLCQSAKTKTLTKCLLKFHDSTKGEEVSHRKHQAKENTHSTRPTGSECFSINQK